MPWYTGVGQGLLAGVQGYQWLEEQKLRKQQVDQQAARDAELAAVRREEIASDTDYRRRQDTDRDEARRELDRTRRESSFYRYRLPAYGPGQTIQPADQSAFDEFAPGSTSYAMLPDAQGRPQEGPLQTPVYTGTDEQRRAAAAKKAILAAHPELTDYFLAEEAGMPAGAVTAIGKKERTPEDIFNEEDARQRAIAKNRAAPRQGNKTDPSERAYTVAFNRFLGENPDDYEGAAAAGQSAYDADASVRSRRGEKSVRVGNPTPTEDIPEGMALPAGMGPGGRQTDIDLDAKPAPPVPARQAAPKVAVGQTVTVKGIGRVTITKINPDGTFDYTPVR